jgi:SAM-dependent methyltransferase
MLPFVDLGSAPPSNAYLTVEQLKGPETWYPLRVLVCERCWLVQTEDFTRAEELFDAHYPYFSSTSSSWLAHAERYVAEMARRFALDTHSYVVEVASNDGYLLQYVRARGIRCTGVEPTASTATVAKTRGLEIVEAFFGEALARDIVSRHGSADLCVANNVLAHTPDINDFVRGFTVLLQPTGVATFEFPHLLRLMAGNQFDTIYHEHFSYLTLTAVERVLTSGGLQVFDVEEMPSHGGSLRVFAQRTDSGRHKATGRLADLIEKEAAAGVRSPSCYTGFQARAEQVKDGLLAFLIDAKRAGKRVAAYGAAAKGSTFLNFAGVRSDLIAFVVDRSPAKQGKFMPGCRIPIVEEGRLGMVRPDYIVILPWNLRTEIMEQLAYVRDWGARFVTALPELEVL